MKVTEYDPDTAVPDLHGKSILITGGNQGIGQHTVLALAKHAPSHIFFTARSQAKAEDTFAQLKTIAPKVRVSVIKCDLTSLASVKAAAQDFLSRSASLDILILNAGIMAVPNALTVDGYEIQMGTNHIGHSLLTKLLLPTLEKDATTKDKRIVVLTSQGAFMSRGIDYSVLKTDGKKRTYLGGTQMLYGDSKLANIYWAQQLAIHHPTITSVSVHPGIVSTGLVGYQSSFQKLIIAVSAKVSQGSTGAFTPAQGAYNSVWAATSEKSGIKNGGYYEPVGNLIALDGMKAAVARDVKQAEKLWEWTMEELKDWTL